MKIRALCTDIDGTLLNRDRELSGRTIIAIQAIKNDVPIILASSRMPAAMRHLQRQLGILSHPLICYNGGYVLQYTTSSVDPVVLDSVYIPHSVCKEILTLAIGSPVHISLYSDDQWFARSIDQWTDKEEMVTKVSPSILPFDTVLKQWEEGGKGAHKVMCMGTEADIEKMYLALYAKFASVLHIYRSKTTYLEIAPKVISKATALALVMKRLFNSDLSEVMAFGDNYNDVEMIQACGYGIAVENAVPAALAVAWQTTTSGKLDGVAIAIEKLIVDAN